MKKSTTMKKIFLMLGLMLSVNLFAFNAGSDEIVNALKQGNANEFSSFFDNYLDIKLPERDEIKNVGKTQAGLTIKNFFDQNNIKGFEPTSQREISGTMYLTGKLQGSRNYNITIMMKDKGDKFSIITVRIN
jgi:hypothetical protein